MSKKLTNGSYMPCIGLGLAGHPSTEKIKEAMEIGYKLFDTAQATEWYNEKDLGSAIKETNYDNLFIITKIHPKNLGYKSTITSVIESLNNLSRSHIDLLLIHYPECFKEICGEQFTPEGTFLDTWRAMEYLYSIGKIKALGLSNVNKSHISKIIDIMNIKPDVIQNWMDPLHQDREVRNLCKKHKIVYQAYSLLGTQWMNHDINPVLTNKTIIDISKNYGWSPTRVIIKWALQEGVAVIPRSINTNHLYENLSCLNCTNLLKEDIVKIRNLDLKTTN